MLKIASAVLVGILGFGVAATAAADDSQQCHVVSPGHISCDDWIIVGRRQVPVQFVLVRSESGYQSVELREHFVREIERTVHSESF